MLRSKWKEIALCLRAGRVTLPYPFAPRNPAPGFRGRPTIDGERCLGCGACAQVCPPRLITVQDTGEKRKIEVAYGRCTYCARCQEVCPVQAIRLTDEFELATAQKDDLKLTVELAMVRCGRCGTPFTTQRMQNKLSNEFSPAWFPVEEEMPEWLGWCPSCRKVQESRKFEGGIKHV